MTGIWRIWMLLWCVGAGLFGLVLAAGAIDSLSAPARLFFQIIDGPLELQMTPHMRLGLATMGSITIGWAFAIAGATLASRNIAPDAAGTLWRWITAGLVVWYALDGALSVMTGFWMNLIPNGAFLILYLVAVWSSGVMQRG